MRKKLKHLSFKAKVIRSSSKRHETIATTALGKKINFLGVSSAIQGWYVWVLGDVGPIPNAKTPVNKDGFCLVPTLPHPLEMPVEHVNNSPSLHLFGPHHPRL